MWRLPIALTALLALMLLGAVLSRSATPRETKWVMTSLEGTSGWDGTQASGINGRGQVIGSGLAPAACDRAECWHAFLWQNGKFTDISLSHEAGSESRAYAINDRGEVVGAADAPASRRPYPEHAFLWQDGRIRDLGTLPGTQQSEAIDVNASGQVVGNSYDNDKTFSRTGRRAFVWQHGKLVDLGTLGGEETSVIAINDRGQAAGWSETASGERHAFVWQHGRMRDLGTVASARQSVAVGINSTGQILVRSGTHAFVWGNGKRTDIGRMSPIAINDRNEVVATRPARNGNLLYLHVLIWAHGRTTTMTMPDNSHVHRVSAINNRGQIVGEFTRPATGALTRAFVWQRGSLTDLGGAPLGAEVYVKVNAINDRGQIVGTAEPHMDYARALLWTPTPP